MSGTVAPLNGLRPDIALQVGTGVQQQQNPLATFGQFATIQNALTQNRALEAGIKQTEQGTAGMAQQQALQRAGMVGQLAGSLLMEHPGGIPAGALADATAALLGAGLIKREEVGPMLLNVPMGADPDSTAKRTAWVRQVHAQALAIPEQIARTRGVPTLVQTGGDQQPMLVGEGGARPIGAGIPNTMDPATAGSLVDVPVMGPDGKPTGAVERITRAEAARRGGVPGTVAPGVFGTGRMPAASPAAPPPPAPAPAAPVAPAPPAAVVPPVAAPARPTGSLGTTQTPAAAAAQTGNAQAGVQMGTSLIQQADSIPAQKAMLGEMETALDQFTTGKGQAAALNAKGYIQSFAPERLARAFGIDPQQIASAETFTKLATQIALAQGAALGINTDQARASLFGGNPNMDLSKLGNKQIIHMLQGNADAIAAKAQAWRESPFFQTGDYAGFTTAWNKQFDPRVFQWAYMDQPERKIMLQNAGKDGQELAAKLRAIYGAR